MAKIFKRILCPIDFDQNSQAALKASCDLVHDQEAVIYLLHVVPVAPVIGGVPLEPYAVTGHEVKAELARMLPRHSEDRVKFELLARKGDAAREIVRAATELAVDSVVIATHRRKKLGRLLLGSVAEKVVRDSPCPVLVVR